MIYSSNNTLWEIKTDPRTGRSVSAARQIGQWSDVDFLDGLHVSADGRNLVLLKGVFGHSVFVAELEDGGKRLQDVRRLTVVGRANYAHAWTPDSKAVVFESFHDGRHQIFKQQIDQRFAELLVTAKESAIAGRFSPDGTWLLYLLGPISVAQKLMRVPASGGLPELVLNIPHLGNYYCTRLPVNLCVAAVREEKQLVFYAFDPGNLRREVRRKTSCEKWLGRTMSRVTGDCRRMAQASRWCALTIKRDASGSFRSLIPLGIKREPVM